MKIAPYQIDAYIQKIADEKIAGCLIFGPERALVSHRFDLVAKKIAPDLSDPFLVANLSKERLGEDKAILADEFFSFSMLGGRKLILVKDCDLAAAAALKLLVSDGDFAKKSENFILVQGGDLDKSSALRKICEDSPYFAALACYEDDERVIKSFLQNELAQKGVKFSAQVLEMLLTKFGKNRQIIVCELEKILTLLCDDKNLTVEQVEKLSGFEADISVNEFVANFAAKNFSLAFLQAEKLLREGSEPVTLLRFLSNYLQKIYQARSEIEGGIDFETAVKNQRLFFKAENGFRAHLKNLSPKFLKKILDRLQLLEIKLKSGEVPPRLVFTDFLQKFIKEKKS